MKKWVSTLSLLEKEERICNSLNGLEDQIEYFSSLDGDHSQELSTVQGYKDCYKVQLGEIREDLRKRSIIV